MKAYFSDLFPKSVRGVTRGEGLSNSRGTKEDKDILGLIPKYDQKGEGCEKEEMTLPPSPLKEIERVSLKVSDTAGSHLSHLITPYNKEDLKYVFEERAAIYQFEAGHSKEEAENLALKDVLVAYLKAYYPEIGLAFEEAMKLGFKDTEFTVNHR